MASKDKEKSKVEVPEGTVQEAQENTVQEAVEKPHRRHPGNWQKMSQEDIEAHSLAGNLVGHDPKTGEVLLVKNPKSIKK